jgi:hypothetical protein
MPSAAVDGSGSAGVLRLLAAAPFVPVTSVIRDASIKLPDWLRLTPTR